MHSLVNALCSRNLGTDRLEAPNDERPWLGARNYNSLHLIYDVLGCKARTLGWLVFSSKNATGSDFTNRQDFPVRECNIWKQLDTESQGHWERPEALSGKGPCKLNKG